MGRGRLEAGSLAPGEEDMTREQKACCVTLEGQRHTRRDCSSSKSGNRRASCLSWSTDGFSLRFDKCIVFHRVLHPRLGQACPSQGSLLLEPHHGPIFPPAPPEHILLESLPLWLCHCCPSQWLISLFISLPTSSVWF